ncbi:rab-GTPase-TBC domain-containing protein [Phyllosticta citrichinensis]|uniref:Rab-GTPase-TBC domain-containing protein n=1 Tax=Phyllosticta citrichinensis TaxID=1130410 RepID=A0ABR1XL39_9PEZI
MDHDDLDHDSATPPPQSPTEPQLHDTNPDKAALILRACRDADLHQLRAFATEQGGLLDDDVRREAWPLLLGSSTSSSSSSADWTTLPPHRDEQQVKLDVNRSFVYYPNDQTDDQIALRKEELFSVIAQVLRRHPLLCYFQGYHDIVQVFLLVLGPSLAVPAITRLSLLRIRDFMLPSLDAAIAHLNLLPAIIHSVDPALCHHLRPTQPFFALAATITMYAHDIQSYGDIARLFDFLLSREAVFSVYLFAAIILARRAELMAIPADEPEILHFTLSKLPSPLDLESLIADSDALFARSPPESLPFRAWGKVSQYSVLKTTRDPQGLTTQSLAAAEELFELHEAQVRRAKAVQALARGVKLGLYRYRRPAGGLGLAVAVGVLAWWLGRNPESFHTYTSMIRLGASYLGANTRHFFAVFVGQFR